MNASTVDAVHGPEVVDWVHRRINSVAPDPNLAQGIGFLRRGGQLSTPSQDLLAGAIYYDCNGVDIKIGVAVVPGFQWSKRTLEIVFAYPFIQLNLHRVTALVSSDNFDSQRFVTRLGCTFEAKLAEACPSGDLLMYRLFRRDCKWLRGN